MKDAIRQYLAKGFDSLFTAYSHQWLDLAAEMAEEARALILSDIGVKYPRFAPADDAGAGLARMLDLDATIAGVALYRLSHALFRHDPKHEALAYFAQFMRVRTGMEIYYSAEIGPRFRVMHGVGLVLGPRHRIGSEFTIYQGVTLGQRRNDCPEEFLTIGNHCTFFAGSAALGLLKIGDKVKLAANAVLLSDAESNSTYSGAPAVKVR
ncbi:MAG: serine O-acetyltransferase [Chthoniobacter sp.]|jgi:serine O-acetyltransferase|nr:serine O-acetyltransferase [Chthoniobacter sp.]